MRIKTPVIERRAAARASIAIAVVASGLCSSATTAAAQTPPWTPPKWFPPVWKHALSIPVPAFKPYPIPGLGTTPPSVINQGETEYWDSAGAIGGYFTGSTIRNPASNAFFQSLGTNGRTCFSCHQPASGMSISTSALQLTYLFTFGQDPVFQPVDGANCPSTPNNHSLLLEKGLFRIFLPMPPNPEFTLTVVSDPTGCNTNSNYNMVVDPTTHQPVQLVSVYRRPRMAANLPFAYTTSADIPANGPAPGEFGQGSVVNSTYCGFADDMGPALGRAGFLIVPGTPIVVTPTTSVKPPYVEAGLCTSGNIMWDGREPTLESQAIDATLGHAQAVTPPTADQVAQMVAFENAFFSAQSRDSQGDLLSSVASPGTAAAGPQYMAQLSTPLTPAILDGTAAPAVGSPGSGAPGLTFFSNWSASKKALQASIYRGQQIFNGGVSFAITDVAGLDNIPFPPGGPGATLGSAGIFNQGASCGVCHSQTAGNDTVAYAQHDLAVGGTPPIPGAVVASAPSPDLPIFKLTCTATASTAFPPTEGTTFYTNDPGLALITGKCADIGRRTVPQLRGLASHAPYFSNGSAATLADVVTFYNTRFNMKLTAQQQTDLVNFLNSL